MPRKNKKHNSSVKTYNLSGGGKVTVYKPFGNTVYAAVVEMTGNYPENGKLAKNINRCEYSIILEGVFEYEINGLKRILKSGDTTLVTDGSGYRIKGNGKVLVLVEDSINGRTDII